MASIRRRPQAQLSHACGPADELRRAYRDGDFGVGIRFEGLRSRQGQAEAILVAYDIMEMDGQDVRPEALEARRKRLAKLLSRKTKAMRDGIQLSAATGAAIFRHACWMGLEGIYWQDEHGRRDQNAKTKSAHTISPLTVFLAQRRGSEVLRGHGSEKPHSINEPVFTDIAQAARLDSLRRARRETSVILASAST
jgi:hypothetical protein